MPAIAVPPLGPCSRGLRRDKPRFANRAKVLRTGLVILRHAIDEHRVRDVVRGAGVSQKLLGEINAPAPIPENDGEDRRFCAADRQPVLGRLLRAARIEASATERYVHENRPRSHPCAGVRLLPVGLPTATPEGHSNRTAAGTHIVSPHSREDSPPRLHIPSR